MSDDNQHLFPLPPDDRWTQFKGILRHIGIIALIAVSLALIAFLVVMSFGLR